MSETALHVLPGQRAYVVIRVEPQFNSRHESLDDAIRQACRGRKLIRMR
jgi:hypothetical protein